MAWTDGELRTAEDPQDDLAILDQREGNRILVAAQKSCRAVDGVEGPVASGGPPLSRAAIDGREYCIVVHARNNGADMVPDAGFESRALGTPKEGGSLFSHDGIVRKGGKQRQVDDGLGTEIGYRDRRPVRFRYRPLRDERRPDRFA
jgi:hypothetical protein